MHRVAIWLGADLSAALKYYRDGGITAYLEEHFAGDRVIDIDTIDRHVDTVALEVSKPARADYCGLWMVKVYAPEPRPEPRAEVLLELRSNGEILTALLLTDRPDGVHTIFVCCSPGQPWRLQFGEVHV